MGEVDGKRCGRWILRCAAQTHKLYTVIRFFYQFRGECAVLTCEGDVEAPVCVGVVRQELQSGNVATGRYGGRKDVSGKGAKDGRFGLERHKDQACH